MKKHIRMALTRRMSRLSFPMMIGWAIAAVLGLVIPCKNSLAQTVTWTDSSIGISSGEDDVVSMPVREIERLERQLSAKGIPTTLSGIRTYLNDIHPSDEQQAMASELISLLGSDSFRERERATQRLFRMPALPTELLKAASEAEDQEIAWRAQSLLNLGQKEFTATLQQVFRVIRLKHIVGLSDELLRSYPMLASAADYRHAREALQATYRPEDTTILVDRLQSEDGEVRLACVFVLASQARDTHAELLRRLVASDKEPDDIRIEAAEGLANLGDRDVLSHLVALLDSESVRVRVRSSLILRRYTGESFRFAAYDQDERRQNAVNEWREWVAQNGATAELQFPLPRSSGRESYLNGNTLLALGYNNRVIEIDPDGNEVYSITAQGAWMAERLENGNTLVAAYSSNQLQEFAPDGQMVWHIEVPSILSARALENGNVLVSQHSNSLAQEYNRDGEVVWQYQASSSVCDAIRLENGNTLIAFGNSIEELSPENEVVWTTTANQIYGISVTETGTILASQLNGNVVEIDKSTKEVIWQYNTSNPVDAIRLPNGNTLITANSEFLEVTPDKEVVWRKGGCNYGTARR